jgi:hypothetical protein
VSLIQCHLGNSFRQSMDGILSTPASDRLARRMGQHGRELGATLAAAAMPLGDEITGWITDCAGPGMCRQPARANPAMRLSLIDLICDVPLPIACAKVPLGANPKRTAHVVPVHAIRRQYEIANIYCLYIICGVFDLCSRR